VTGRGRPSRAAAPPRRGVAGIAGRLPAQDGRAARRGASSIGRHYHTNNINGVMRPTPTERPPSVRDAPNTDIEKNIAVLQMTVFCAPPTSR